MVKVLLNENTAGDIPSRRWHLMALMLKIISKLQFTFIYNLLVPCVSLLLIVIAILTVVVIVVVIVVIIVPYDE